MNILFDQALQNPLSTGENAHLLQELAAGYQVVTSVRSVPDHKLPVWHITIFRSGQPVIDWTEEQIAYGIYLLREFCNEIDPDRTIKPLPGSQGIHFIKPLNDPELRIVSPDFMAKHVRYQKWVERVSANAVKRGANPNEVTPARLGMKTRKKVWRSDENTVKTQA